MLEMLDWKLMLSMVMAFFLLTAGLVKDIGQGIQGGDLEKVPQKFLKRVKQRMDFSDLLMSVPVTREITVKGSFKNKKGFQFDGVPVKEILLSTSSLNMTADRKRVTSNKERVNITFSGFQGKVNVSENGVRLEGNVDSLQSEAINLKGNNFAIKNKGEFNRLELINIELKELKLEDVSGNIKSNSGVSIPLNENPTELSGFLGNMTFEGSEVEIEGDVNRVYSETNGTKTVLSS